MLTLLFLGAIVPTAWAQTTLSRLEPILLPDGREASAAIRRNDGILVADRLQFVVLDKERRVLAQSPESAGLSLICDGESRSCSFYDHDENSVLDLVPSGFRSDGPRLPDVREFENLFELQGGAWGFDARPANWSEWVRAEAALTREAPVGFSILALVGMLCAVIATKGVRRWKRPSFWSVSIWILGILGRVLAVVALFVVAVFFSALMSGVCGTYFLAGFGGGGAVYALFRLFQRRRRARRRAPHSRPQEQVTRQA